MTEHIFISHSSKDDAVVRRLRETLESHGSEVWVDSRDLSGGDFLSPIIKEKIETAKRFVALLGIDALSSSWVQQDLKLAQAVAEVRGEDGYKAISLDYAGSSARTAYGF